MKTKTLLNRTAEDWLLSLDSSSEGVCLLTGNGEGWGTVLAWDPAASYVYYRGQGEEKAGDFVAEQQAVGRKVFGFVGYDLGYELHGIRQTAKDDLGLPDICLLAYDNYLDIGPDSTVAHYRSDEFIKQTESLKPTTRVEQILSQPFKPDIGKQDYDRAYQKVKRYILDGDVYQANLTHRLEAKTDVPPRQVFARLLGRTTAGFMAYIEGPDFAVHSVSPERFVRINDGAIETFPIKGTRPRGRDPRDDERLTAELLDSAKDAAELNMITDLLRNDLGRVCAPGSVKVAEKREILTTPTVIHTYSRVTGKLLDDVRPMDAVLSMSPGGSITGCPKKRAMEIIDELEPKTRSVYCGSVVMVEPDGRLDSNIAIRTLIQKDGRLVLQVGGGIVHASDGDEEYQETWDKAAAIVNALN